MLWLSLFCLMATNSCKMSETTEQPIRIMTLDPGHFHAALVQKKMYDQVSPQVHVFAPEGDDVKFHLKRIDGFNSRADNPTSWKETVYTGDDFFEKMILDKPGNVVMISGNNQAGMAGQPLDLPFVVEVVDQHGRAVAGAVVLWDIVEGGGDLPAVPKGPAKFFHETKTDIV